MGLLMGGFAAWRIYAVMTRDHHDHRVEARSELSRLIG